MFFKKNLVLPNQKNHNLNETKQLTNANIKINQMLELSDKDFKEAVIKVLQYAIINFLETSKNIENVCKEIEITKNAIT